MLGARVFHEEAVEPLGGFFVELDEAGAEATRFVGLGVVGFFLDGDVGALSQFSHRVGKGEVLVLHDEADGVTTFAAPEAFEVLAGRIDIKGRGLFVVKGAEGLESGASTFDREVGGNEVHDVGRGEHLFDCFLRNAWHWEQASTGGAGGERGLQIGDDFIANKWGF